MFSLVVENKIRIKSNNYNKLEKIAFDVGLSNPNNPNPAEVKIFENDKCLFVISRGKKHKNTNYLEV